VFNVRGDRRRKRDALQTRRFRANRSLPHFLEAAHNKKPGDEPGFRVYDHLAAVISF